MKNNWTTKILISILLAGFFLAPVGGTIIKPGVALAQTPGISIQAPVVNVRAGNTFAVNVTTSNTAGSGVVTFVSNPVGLITTTESCLASGVAVGNFSVQCTLRLNSSATGTLTLNASATINGNNYTSNSIQISASTSTVGTWYSTSGENTGSWSIGSGVSGTWTATSGTGGTGTASWTNSNKQWRSSTGSGTWTWDFGTGTDIGTTGTWESINPGGTSGATIANGGWGGGKGLSCGITNLDGCLAWLTYKGWELTAWFANLGGQLLDFFVYYSTNDESYRNAFVEEAWKIIRDIANIFFIVSLLYIAIKTILGLNVSDNKKLISAIIIIGLIINFSLFTSKLIIDTSNILAKIFYNNISAIDENGKPSLGAAGQTSISIGLIKQFDPQKIVDTPTKYKDNEGTFIFICVFALLLTGWTAYIFFTIGIMFVARVVSLWIRMIFSPIAFVSYAVPFEIPGLGHKEWWDDLLHNAFLAPVFIFFLYIIIMFAGFLKTVVVYGGSDKDTIQHIMTIAIPFIIIAALLKKAEELAEKYAGEMGNMITKGFKTALGTTAALGLGVGGSLAAKGLQASIGQFGSRMRKTTWVKNRAAGVGGNRFTRFVGKTAKWSGRKLGTSSFDIRRGVVGGGLKLATKLTGLDLGHKEFFPTEKGGFEADRRRKKDSDIQDFWDNLDVGHDEQVIRTLDRAEASLKQLMMENEHDLNELRERANTWRQRGDTARTQETAGRGGNGSGIFAPAVGITLPSGTTIAGGAEINYHDLQEVAGVRIRELETHRRAIRTGDTYIVAPGSASDGMENTSPFRNTTDSYDGASRSIGFFQDEEIPHLNHQISQMRNARLWAKAHGIERGFFSGLKYMNAGGLYALFGHAQEETANALRKEMRAESGGGGSSGGGHGHS